VGVVTVAVKGSSPVTAEDLGGLPSPGRSEVLISQYGRPPSVVRDLQVGEDRMPILSMEEAMNSRNEDPRSGLVPRTASFST
jgi:hypothetical protein